MTPTEARHEQEIRDLADWQRAVTRLMAAGLFAALMWKAIKAVAR